MTTGPWKLKASTAKYLVCDVCGAATRWDTEKSDYRLCDEHNTWWMYFRLQWSFRRQHRPSTLDQRAVCLSTTNRTNNRDANRS